MINRIDREENRLSYKSLKDYFIREIDREASP